MDKYQHKSQPIRAKQRYHHLHIAKAEKAHAEANRKKMEAKGDEYGVHVYTVRIKALALYIKTLEKPLKPCENS